MRTKDVTISFVLFSEWSMHTTNVKFHWFYFQNEICRPKMSQLNYFLFSEWTETSKNEPPVLNIVSIPPALPFIYLFIYLLNKYNVAMKQISFVSETKSFVYET